VAVDPDLYVALGISGAVQHVTGLGQPRHVVAVNTDASAPMMALADLAIVTDARALLRELATRLGVAGAGTTDRSGAADAGT
jgi:electron transfer flavoprotein alpha subunit